MQQGALGEQQEAYVEVGWDLGNMLPSLRAGTLYSEDRHTNGELEGSTLAARRREDSGRTRYGELRWKMQKLCIVAGKAGLMKNGSDWTAGWIDL